MRALLALLLLPLSLFGEQTLAMIKPEAVQSNRIGEIIAAYEKEGLRVAGLKMTRLSKTQAAAFYKEHEGRPFYENLTTYMSSSPIIVLVLEGDQAIKQNRELMGPTDPSKAQPGTLRARFGTSVSQNAVHGSDSVQSAEREVNFFFKEDEILEKRGSVDASK